jgi:hypothetical protein
MQLSCQKFCCDVHAPLQPCCHVQELQTFVGLDVDCSALQVAGRRLQTAAQSNGAVQLHLQQTNFRSDWGAAVRSHTYRVYHMHNLLNPKKTKP